MQTFKASRVIQSHTVRAQFPAKEVFPLLCPVREYDWIDTRDCGMVYSDSGTADTCNGLKQHPPSGLR